MWLLLVVVDVDAIGFAQICVCALQDVDLGRGEHLRGLVRTLALILLRFLNLGVYFCLRSILSEMMGFFLWRSTFHCIFNLNSTLSIVS